MTPKRRKTPSRKSWNKLSHQIIESGYPQKLWTPASTYALGYLEQGRPDFDIPHTQAVVCWAFRLATDYNRRVAEGAIENSAPVDVNVLVSAALFHDIGYYGKFDEDPGLAEISNRKAEHMVVGARMAKKFFETLPIPFFDEEQINQICHLVSVHDNLNEIHSIEETILLEADTLGAIDINWVEPTYQGEQALEGYLERDRTRKRHELFQTPLARESLDEKLKTYRQFVIDRDFNGVDPTLKP